MKTKLPFLYIAGLMRTGSTLVQEILMEEGKSFIFHEPWFSSGYFDNFEMMADILKEWGITVEGNAPVPILLHDLSNLFEQIGVKEIRHSGYEMYFNLFEDIKFVICVRDPRDIYISKYYQLERNPDIGRLQFPPLSPEGLYKELEPDIKRQMEMYDNHVSKVVKYEILNADHIKEWCKSPVENSFIGGIHKHLKRGEYENGIHNGKMTNKAVNRYKTEQDPILKAQANEFFELMKEYNEFWGYET